jgi:hypothetical protein
VRAAVAMSCGAYPRPRAAAGTLRGAPPRPRPRRVIEPPEDGPLRGMARTVTALIGG